MFKKILIANRGEIALRVIFACRELGIKTVAVYSEADENSLHVRFADEDICIGPARSSRQLPERPGDHQRRRDHRRRRHPPRLRLPVRERLPRRGVRGLPHPLHRPRPARHPPARRQGQGAPGDEEGRPADAARQRRPGRERGARAAAGQGHRLPGDRQGGGRRRRPRHAHRARRPASSPHALRTAQREAEAAFGNGDVYLERYLESPRHIEFQILGDHHGAVVHLGERECSIQRRHQKLIEESPSPVITDKVRRKMGALVADARPGRAVHQRRHVRVPDGRQGPLLLHGDEHPRPGRAPGDRDGDRARPRQGADPHRRRRAAVVPAERRDLHRARDRVPDQRRGSRDLRAVAGRDPRLRDSRRPGRARRHARRTPSARSRRTTTR